MSRAELFIASFGSAGGEQGLRSGELEMREQVRLAFYGIDATRVDVERGRLSPQDGERIIDSFEQTLRNYVHDHANDALVVASTGQAHDVPAIARTLGTLLGVARQDALLGREEIAMEAQRKMVQVLRSFSENFAATCDQQTFPAELALAIARQNEMLGTGIDVTHCAKRRLTATIDHRQVKYRWENCSVDGGGTWKATLSGFLAGEAEVTGFNPPADDGGEGLLEVSTRVEGRSRYRGVTDDWTLKVELRITGRTEAPPSPAVAPNDAGPHARPNGWPQAPVPEVPSRHFIKVGTLRHEAIYVVGDGYYPTPEWVEGPIHLEDKPCRD